MRVTLGFDGVFTERWKPGEVRGLDEQILFLTPLSITMAEPRPGIVSLVALLRSFASVEILSDRPESQVPAIRSWLSEHLPGFAAVIVHSCKTAVKGEFVQKEGVALHIDDDDLAAVGAVSRCVVWRDQPLKELFRQVVGVLAHQPAVYLGENAVQELVELPSHSSTPVFRVESSIGSLKLRIVDDADQSAHLREIHAVASADKQIASLLPAELPGYPEGIHVTPFFNGVTIASGAHVESERLLEAIAGWFAALHQTTSRADGTCLVSCACDAFNLCVENDSGSVRIIDAGDACRAPRWVDLVWSEQLLCPWLGGAETLMETYIDIAGVRPTHEDVTCATAGYYYRLHSVLRAAARARSADASDLKVLREVRAKRASPPRDSTLRRFAI